MDDCNEKVAEAHTRMEDALESMDVVTKMAKFEKEHAKNPMFTVFRQYMTMVPEMLMFIRAIRSADWLLHLQALEIFTKYYFTHDRLKVTGHAWQRSSENRHCALNISPIFIKFSPIIRWCM